MIFSPGLVTELVAGHGGSVDGVWLAGKATPTSASAERRAED